jgi:hypothetical protein
MIIAAACTRFLPHPPNFTPIGAMALFGGYFFTEKRWSIFVPLFAMFLSDLVIGLHDTLIYVYVSFALISVIGMALKNIKNHTIALPILSVLASLLFYGVTNFGVWAAGILYPLTTDGLIMSYVAGLPFLVNTIAGDAFYVVALFGGWSLLQRSIPSLRLNIVR